MSVAALLAKQQKIKEEKEQKSQSEGRRIDVTPDKASPTTLLPQVHSTPAAQSSLATPSLPPIVPFGEYVRHILALRADSETGRIATRCSTLYIFRNDPERLKRLMSLWFHRARTTCKSLKSFRTEVGENLCQLCGDLTENPRARKSDAQATEDAWINHMLGILQCCVERYFSKNWDLQKQVVEANTEYRQFQENQDGYLDSLSLSGQESGSGPTSSSETSTESTPRHKRSNSSSSSFAVPTDFTWLTNFDFEQIKERHDADGFLVVFHAEFSEPSCELLRLLHSMRKRHLRKKGDWTHHETAASPLMREETKEYEAPLSPQQKSYFPEIFAIDSTSEFALFQKFDVRWFPTMIFFYQGKHTIYPSEGVIRQPQFLEEWFRSRGSSKPHTKKIRNFVTKAAMLEAKQRYVGARQLATAVMMINKLKCTSDVCGVRQSRPDDDPPVFIFLGGGMAAGKTTAVSWLTKGEWWKKHGDDTVTVDADAFKHADPLFRTSTTDLHKRSLDAAEQLLVQAVNEGRDIIFDGTMSWEPFVRQTVKMVRDSRNWLYKRGPGYDPKVHTGESGAPEETYWETDLPQSSIVRKMPPYLIQLIGVTVDPKVGVHRAILRQLASGRNVPVGAQLRSYRYFSQNFETYASLCDDVILFNNNVHVDLEKGQSPIPISRKELGETRMRILDEEAWNQFTASRFLNDAATSADEVFPPSPSAGSESGGLSRQGSTMSMDGTPSVTPFSGGRVSHGASPGIGMESPSASQDGDSLLETSSESGSVISRSSKL